MVEPETMTSESVHDESMSEVTKKRMATILTIGIIIGLLVIIFAVTIIIINLIPGEQKWVWLITTATIGNWILLVGIGLVEFFFALTLSIYIWKKGRNYLLKRV